MSGLLPEPVLAFLREAGLAAADETPPAAALAGGVSSDIWKVELRSGPVCVKRALARLRVAQVWEAPVERNRYEWRWLQAAARIVPGSAPRVLAHDEAGVFAMEFLDGASHPVWKDELRAGRAEPAFAARVGGALARIHAATSGDASIAAAFATDAGFHAIRLEPYLLATAGRHPDLAPRLRDLAARTAATREALVHGDVSPKNILVAPGGPVFLDAECAWYGDPAFDVAFCLNHLLLKCLWVPAAAPGFLACFDALATAYFGVHRPRGLEARAASLLPGLLLARVDGKSPVEYLTDEPPKARVRRVARALLETPPQTLAEVRTAWQGS
ncbi:MAG TPA: aminoglycoside phosphotransferase family protein [Burkholderiales bacterium]|nr:aminoglycoside phosphotransferase family protein [Burkholderiales bacterium]